ncbi:MAG: hypothetical protein JNK82_17125 [Myxococcaceae bacterium]|nr:hypothetical protein [Myxococcaceae bacterium]
MKIDHASAVRPYKGLQSCGDAAVHVAHGKAHRFVIIDALGHGPDAEKTAKKLSALVRETVDLQLPEVFARCDAELTGTQLRGAAMGALEVKASESWFTGVGNIDVYGPRGARRPVCIPGTLGRQVRKLRLQPVDLTPGTRWFMVSDGLRVRDLPKAMESTSALAPREAAAQVLDAAARPDDDASIWVLDFTEGGA